MVEAVRSEDTLVFVAVSPQYTSYEKFVRVLREFFERKQEIDPQDRFNIITFRDVGPAYFEDFTYNVDHLAETLTDLGPRLAVPNMAGGIFVAITFIIDVFKIVGGKCFRLVIISDASAPPLTKEELISDLLYQVRDMPFFMDVIRLQSEDASDDWRLEKLAKITKGSLQHADSLGELRALLSELAEKKKLAYPGLDKEGFTIGVENVPFYENMAQAPAVVPPEEQGEADKCSICFQKECMRCHQEVLQRCPKCGALAHDCCWANWTESSHMGLQHLFRCHQCYNLLKLPKAFVAEVLSGKAPAIGADFAPSSQYDLLRDKDQAAAPSLVDADDPFLAALMEVEEAKESASQDVDAILCPNCKSSLPPTAKFCNKCGTKIQGQQVARETKSREGSIMDLSNLFGNRE